MVTSSPTSRPGLSIQLPSHHYHAVHHRPHHHSFSHTESPAQDHHVRRARSMLEAMTCASAGARGSLQSSPVMLSRQPLVSGPVRRLSTSKSVGSDAEAAAGQSSAVEAVDECAEAVDSCDEEEDATRQAEMSRQSQADGDPRSEAIVLALRVLLEAHAVADDDESNEVAILGRDALDTILKGFVKSLEATAQASGWNASHEVEKQMEKLFVSHSNVFDERVQDFIIQNFIQESNCAKTFRSAMRRTSLLRRCLKAMHPREKPAPVMPAPTNAAQNLAKPHAQTRHWSGSLAERVVGSIVCAACPEMTNSDQVNRIKLVLAELSSWEFDLFTLTEMAPGRAFSLIGNELLDMYNLCAHFRTTKAKQFEFLEAIQKRYLPNPYHNAEHAADVAQALHHFFSVGMVGATINPRNLCAALLAALVHDVGHTGFTNNFHIALNDDLAVRYVYRSPLEHMHCAIAFQAMSSTKTNVLESLTRIEQLEIRTLITDLVLATDNSVHATYLAKLEGLVCRAADSAGWTPSVNPDDERLVLQMALHSADVSNPAKTLPLCKIWAARIRDEFYEQGDKELELDLPRSIGSDRENPIPLEKMQAGFILGIVRPLFAAFCQLPGAKLGHCMDRLDQNLHHWQSQIPQIHI